MWFLLLLNLLRLLLWPTMLSTLDNVPCFLEKNVYRHISFYCSSQTLCVFFFFSFANWGFVATLHLVYQHHFYNSICLPNVSVLFLQFPQYFRLFITVIIFVIVICNQSSLVLPLSLFWDATKCALRRQWT